MSEPLRLTIRECEPHELQRCEGCWYLGTLYVCTPNGLVGNLSRHTVTKHDDDAVSVGGQIHISVTPSILTWTNRVRYHGYIERSEWCTLSDTHGDVDDAHSSAASPEDATNG